MNLLLKPIEDVVQIALPVNFVFWGYVAAYVIHLLDESLMGETFVVMLQKDFCPRIHWKHFFVGNTFLMSLLITANVVYDILGHAWIIAPLSFVFLFVTNGVLHLIATIMWRKYSPGLVSSLLYWLLFYFLLRYAILPGTIPASSTIMSALIGSFITVLMIACLVWLRKRYYPDG